VDTWLIVVIVIAVLVVLALIALAAAQRGRAGKERKAAQAREHLREAELRGAQLHLGLLPAGAPSRSAPRPRS
jgi:Tfp pilus assembly protein PilX